MLDNGEEAERALGLLQEKYEQYRRERPGLPVLAVDLHEWRGWNAARESKPSQTSNRHLGSA